MDLGLAWLGLAIAISVALTGFSGSTSTDLVTGIINAPIDNPLEANTSPADIGGGSGPVEASADLPSEIGNLHDTFFRSSAITEWL